MNTTGIIDAIKAFENAGAQVMVNIQVKDEGKHEDYSIDVGPADFRATLRFSDFADLQAKLKDYKAALEDARKNGLCAGYKSK